MVPIYKALKAAPAPLNTEQDAAKALRDAGLKATPQRLAILRSLSGDVTHPTAQELYDRLRADFPGLSVATVYNTLSALTRADHCRPLDLGGAVRFDPNVSAHDHAVCERCGAIRDVVLEDERPVRRVTGFKGFEVSRVERIYRGVCAACAEAREPAAPSPH